MIEAAIQHVRRAADDRPLFACSHCGLPVPPGLAEPASTEQFCCDACRTVFRVIRDCGLDRYYELRETFDALPAPARIADSSYTAFDAPEFLGRHVRRRESGLMEMDLYLEGVHCAACVWLVEKLPRLCDGVIESRLELTRSLVRIVWDEHATPLSKIARTLNRLGYPPHPARGGEARIARQREDSRFVVRIGVAGALAGNVMLLAFSLYSGLLDAIEAPHLAFIRWASLALGSLAVAWPGSIFFSNALTSLRARSFSLDVPIALALLLGAGAGAINVMRGSGEIYFDSLAMLVFLLLVGRWFQRSRQRRAAEAVEQLYSTTPASVTLLEMNTPREAPVEAVRPGDTVLVKAGETIPVDGVISFGNTRLSTAVLTGESCPIGATVGDSVFAGAVNIAASIHVRTEAAGEATRLGGIMRDIESAAGAGERISGLVDRFSRQFMLIALSLAIITLAIWLRLDPAHAVEHAIALLIVTCPCALGLATPLAVTMALGRAARLGLFIKNGDTLESLASPGLLLLDKTGTLTDGHLRVVEWIGDRSIIAAVAALERDSSHPFAHALVEYAGSAVELSDSMIADEIQHTGCGVSGWIDGARIAAGSFDFIKGHAPAPAWFDDAKRTLLERRLSPLLIARDGEIVAVAGLGDRVREDSARALAELRSRGWRLGILSGDDPAIVHMVAHELGGVFDPMIGGADPEAKRRIVETHKSAGNVVFVGDGVNDAPALQCAVTGIAVHGGAEASLAAAHVYLTRPGVMPLVELVGGAMRTQGVIRRNITAALLYNAIVASLAMSGMISPIIGAVLMPVSSLTVLTLSMRARTFRQDRP